jgi:MFS family permease
LAAEARADKPHAVRESLADRRIWLIGLIDAAILLGLYAIAFWLPSIIRSHHVSDPVTVGVLSALPQIAAALSMFAIGLHSDRHRERRWHIAIPMLLGAALLAYAVSSNAGLAAQLLLLSAANAAILGAIPPLWAVPTSFLSGPGAAAGLALAGSVANTAGFAATYVVGWSVSAGYGIGLPFTLFALCLVAGGIAALWLPRPADST